MKRTLLILLGVFILMQFIKPSQQNAQIISSKEFKTADTKIMQMFETSCYDCHSNNTKWPWYSNIAPLSWGVSSHVKNGRMALNFSTWEDYTALEKKDKIKSIYKKVYAAMPLASYTMLHKEAELTTKQRKYIRNWAKKERK